MSYISLVQLLICLPEIKPFCVVEIMVFKTFKTVSYSTWGKLIETGKSEMGRQFPIKLLSFFPFGIQVIIHCLREVESVPFLKQILIAFVIKCLSLHQKTFKNSVVKPSIPGDLLCFLSSYEVTQFNVGYFRYCLRKESLPESNCVLVLETKWPPYHSFNAKKEFHHIKKALYLPYNCFFGFKIWKLLVRNYGLWIFCRTSWGFSMLLTKKLFLRFSQISMLLSM